MRFFSLAAVLGLFILPHTGHAEEKSGPASGASRTEAKLSPADQAAQSAAMAKAARDQSDTLDRARDRRMREISKGICTGC